MRINPMAETTLPREEDLTSVGTRISWAAVLAGAVVAMAFSLVLTMLGGAIAMSINAASTTTPRIETVAGWGLVWALLATGLSLFAGGWVTSQLTAGETKCEAMVHGVILWGTVFAIMLWLT